MFVITSQEGSEEVSLLTSLGWLLGSFTRCEDAWKSPSVGRECRQSGPGHSPCCPAIDETSRGGKLLGLL